MDSTIFKTNYVKVIFIMIYMHSIIGHINLLSFSLVLKSAINHQTLDGKLTACFTRVNRTCKSIDTSAHSKRHPGHNHVKTPMKKNIFFRLLIGFWGGSDECACKLVIPSAVEIWSKNSFVLGKSPKRQNVGSD